MRVLEINSCVNGSTGSIIKAIKNYLDKMNDECITSSRKDFSKRKLAPNNHIFIGNILSKHFDNKLAYFTGKEGHFTKLSTFFFRRKIDKFDPDIIHLHNLHANYINLEMLFRYIKKNKIKVVWTLHDCWSFTGHCPHFEMQKCYLWKHECRNCTLFRDYPASRIDNSTYMYNEKKRIFRGVEGLTIVTPSEWLEKLVKKSFLSVYNTKVINNGIRIDSFCQKGTSILHKKYGISNDKIIILGVASGWEERKGLNVFDSLSKDLSEKYVIVLVGISETVKKRISSRIIAIERTENQDELASIYSEADIFLNPTLEDTYPTVNIEAICCGTPVFTYNTGGSSEIIKEGCGKVIERGNYKQLKEEIINYNREEWDRNLIVSNRKYFSEKRMAEEYYNLYKEMLNNESEM